MCNCEKDEPSKYHALGMSMKDAASGFLVILFRLQLFKNRLLRSTHSLHAEHWEWSVCTVKKGDRTTLHHRSHFYSNQNYMELELVFVHIKSMFLFKLEALWETSLSFGFGYYILVIIFGYYITVTTR